MAKISVVRIVAGDVDEVQQEIHSLRALICEGVEFEIVLVTESLSPSAWALVVEFVAKVPGTKAVRLSRRFGPESATVAGLTHADGDAVIFISEQVSSAHELIPNMIQSWKQGRQVVIGMSTFHSDGLLRRLVSGIFFKLLRRVTFRDWPSGRVGICLLDRKVVNVIVGLQERNSSLLGQIMWVGFQREVVTLPAESAKGRRSRMTLPQAWKAFLDCLVAFSSAPIRAAQSVGTVISICGLIYGAVVVFQKLSGGLPVPGWASVIVASLLLGGLNLISLGVIGEYLWRNLDETKRRPLYVVDTIVTRKGHPHQ